MIIKIDASYLHLLNPFRSGQSGAEALNCFHIRPSWSGGGVVIEALNYHRYGVFHDVDSVCESSTGVVFSPSEELMKACKPGKVRINGKRVDKRPFLVIEAKPCDTEPGLTAVAVRVEADGMAIFVEPNPADSLPRYQFPNTEKFLAARRLCHTKDAPSMHEVCFPATEFAMFDFGHKDNRGIVMHPSGPEGPCFVTVMSHPNFLGIIMPMEINFSAVYGDARDNRLDVVNPHKVFLPYVTLPTARNTEQGE